MLILNNINNTELHFSITFLCRVLKVWHFCGAPVGRLIKKKQSHVHFLGKSAYSYIHIKIEKEKMFYHQKNNLHNI